MTYLFNPNGDLTVMHLADHDRLGAVIGALCGETDFSRSCNLPLGRAICTKCKEVDSAVQRGEADAITHGLGAETLLGRAVKAARKRHGRHNTLHPRWVAVMDTFTLGSTAARELCAHFGLDPYEQVKRCA